MRDMKHLCMRVLYPLDASELEEFRRPKCFKDEKKIRLNFPATTRQQRDHPQW